jgi:hypothetical protein
MRLLPVFGNFFRVVGVKNGFKNCVPQLTRPDCIRYQALCNFFGKIYKIFIKRMSARAFGTGIRLLQQAETKSL